jgi:hypothetical protein
MEDGSAGSTKSDDQGANVRSWSYLVRGWSAGRVVGFRRTWSVALSYGFVRFDHRGRRPARRGGRRRTQARGALLPPNARSVSKPVPRSTVYALPYTRDAHWTVTRPAHVVEGGGLR